MPRSPAAGRSRPRVGEVWELVSDPYSLPRWWPRTSGSRTSSAKGGGRRAEWTKVLETAEGRGVRADFRCLELGRGRALRLGAAARRGRRSSATCAAPRSRSALAEDEGGTEVSLTAEQTLRGMSRLGSPMMRRGQGALLDEALDGIERALTGVRRRSRAATRSGGAGGTRDTPELDGPALATLRERVGELRPSPRAADARGVRAARRRAAAPGADRGGRRGERLHRRRGPGPPRDRLRLRRPGPAALRPARGGPRRRPAPGRRRTQCAACWRSARRRASRSSPSAAAPASSAGSSRCAARHERLVSLDLARLRGVEVDAPLADRDASAPACAGPEAEAALAEHGVVLGHFPQSFEYATIGGFAATRSAGQASSGYGRFDALVSSVRLIAPAGDAAHAGDPAHRRRPGPARAGRRLGGRLRRDPRGHRAGAPGAAAAPLRGLDRRGLRGRAPRSSAPWRRARACRT